MRLAEGEDLAGRYRLVRRLGSGGMADVWLAEDTTLDRKVALKFLHERFARDEEFVERFRREAKAAAALSHPNVVGVYDRGTIDDQHYIAMEYVEGASLRDLILGGMTTAEAVEVTRQILAGAGYAHEHGIVHRDLKPQNVMIDREGRVRVTDFGIARAGRSEITQTNSVLGTAQYLSPEQAQGFEVTGAADLYSIGVMLFEQLTGDVPFDAETPVAVVLKQISDRPPKPSDIEPDVSPALDAVVLTALSKQPENRFASAAEFSSALLEAFEGRMPAERATELYGAIPAAAAGAALGAAAAAASDPDSANAADGTPGDGEAGEEDDPLTKRFWTRKRAIAAGAAVALLAGAGLAFALTRSSETEIPNVTGSQQAEAESRIERAGFEAAISQEATCEEEGVVFEQSPAAGTEAEEGSRVALIVSTGADLTVPDVAGDPAAAAAEALRERELRPVEDPQRSTRVDEGRVIETDPAAGEAVECGQRVTLAISTGIKKIDVPDLVGADQDSAEMELDRLGLVPDVDTEDSDQPEGTVLEQNPAPGSSIRRGSTVTLTVSSGVGTVEVPEVIGQPESTAVSILQGRGAVNIRVVDQTTDVASEDGRVLDQAPGAGSRIQADETVTLFVGVFEEPEETTTTTTTRPPTTTPTPPTEEDAP